MALAHENRRPRSGRSEASPFRPGHMLLDHDVSTGALLTTHVAVSAVVLKAVLPPVLPLPFRFTLPPSLPLVWSQAYACKLTVPAKPAFGTKRIRSLPESNCVAFTDTAPKVIQFEPPSREYCHM